MKKNLLIPISLIISLTSQPILIAQELTCEQQYEAWIIMRVCDVICDFSPDMKEAILEFARQTKFGNNSYCNSILTEKKRDDIDMKVLSLMRNTYMDYVNKSGQQGHQTFCNTAKKIVLGIQNNN